MKKASDTLNLKELRLIVKAFHESDNSRLSNHDLSKLCPKFGARLRTLRENGYVIEVVSHDKKTLTTTYEFFPD